MKKFFAIAITLLAAVGVKAQIETPVKWQYAAKRVSATEAVVYFKAQIDEGWHLYSQKVPDGGPAKTEFTFNPSKTYTLVGGTAEPAPVKRFEKVFGFEVPFFENEVVFHQKIRLKSAAAVNVTGKFEYMSCNDRKCLPPEEVKFSIPVKAMGK